MAIQCQKARGRVCVSLLGCGILGEEPEDTGQCTNCACWGVILDCEGDVCSQADEWVKKAGFHAGWNCAVQLIEERGGVRPCLIVFIALEESASPSVGLHSTLWNAGHSLPNNCYPVRSQGSVFTGCALNESLIDLRGIT